MIGSIIKFVFQARTAAFEKRDEIIHFEIISENINKIIQITEIIEKNVVINFRLLFFQINFKSARSY